MFVFYSTDADSVRVSSLSMCASTLEEIEQRLHREKEICRAFGLSASTCEKLLYISGSLLLGAKLAHLRSSFLPLLDQGRYAAASTLVDLIGRLEPLSLTAVHSDFQDFVRELLGRAMLLIAKGAAKNPRLFCIYVETLIDFHNRFSEIIDCWLAPSFRPALASAFRQVINQNDVTRLGIQPTRLLTRYVDYLLRQQISSSSSSSSSTTASSSSITPTTTAASSSSSSTTTTSTTTTTTTPPIHPSSSSSKPTTNTNNTDNDENDHDNESTHQRLSLVLDYFFSLIEAKEFFIDHYAKDCAKRILYRLSRSEEWEQEAVALLKRHADERALEPVDRMFNDLYESVEFQTELVAKLSKRKGAVQLDFNLLIVSPARWPIPLVPFQFAKTISPEIASFEKAVDSFFLTKHPGKKLLMLHHFARGHLHANFCTTGDYTLLCSGSQVAVLLLFNAAAVCSYDQMQSRTLLPENELCLAVNSLLRAQLLVTEPLLSPAALPLRPNASHVFRLNRAFSCPKPRVRISELMPLQTSVDRITEQNCVIAAIVRLIKPVSVMTYSRLVSALLSQLKNRFEPDTQLIGASLAALVDRRILSFDPEKNNYTYLHADE